MATGTAIRAGRAFVEVFANTAPLTRGLRLAAAKLRDFGNRVRGLGLRLGGALLLPGLGIAKMITSFARFEQTMSKVESRTQAAADQMDVLRARAKALGRTTVFTASQVADAMAELALGGLRVGQIMSTIAPILNLAAGAQLEVGETALIAVKTMNALQLEAKDMGRIADVMTGGFTNATTTLVQLGDAMKFIGPLAQKAGLSLEETVASISLLSSSGEAASKAGTGLRGLLTRLTNPPAEAQRKLRDLRVEPIDKKTGDFKKFSVIIGDLQDALDGLGTGAKLAALGKIFPNRQIGAAAILIGEGEMALRSFTQMLENTGGLAKKVAAIQLNNLSGSFTLLTSAIESVAIELGEVFVGPLRIALDQITKIVRESVQWVKSNRTLVLSLGLAFVGLVALAAMLVTVGIGMSTIALVGTGLGAVLGAIGTVVAAVLSPMGLFIASIVAVGSSLLLTGDRMHDFGDVIDSVVTFITNAFQSLSSEVETALSGIRDALSFGDLATATEILWVTMKILWIKGTSALSDLWTAAMSGVVKTGRDLWQSLQTFLAAIWFGLADTFFLLTAGLQRAWAGFTGFVKKAQLGLTKFLTRQFNKINGLFNPTFDVEAANLASNDIFDEEILQIDIANLDLADKLASDLEKKRVRAQEDFSKLVDRLAEERASGDQARIDKLAKNKASAEKKLAELIEQRDVALAKAKEDRLQSNNKKELEKLKKRDRVTRDLNSAGSKASGIFNAAALLSLEGSRGDTEIVRNGKKTVEILQEINRRIRKNRASFV